MASSYSQKLKDPRWQKKRLEIMGRDNFCCRLCSDDGATLHVHHKHYFKGREPWEYEEHELVTVCESCHDAAHEMSNSLKRVVGHFDMDGPWSVGVLTALAAGYRDAMELTRGREAVVDEWFNFDPASYLIGEIASVLYDAMSVKGEAKMFGLAGAAEIAKARGGAWVIDALLKANEQEDGVIHGKSQEH